MGSGPQSELSDALAKLWVRFLPEMLERVRVLDSAGCALEAGTLDEGARAAAGEAAHKLAGALGTFGLPEGTALAREAEQFYASRSAAEAASIKRMREIARELEALVRTHKAISLAE